MSNVIPFDRDRSSDDDKAAQSALRRKLHRQRERQSQEHLARQADLEDVHQEKLDKLDRARTLLDSLEPDLADSYRDRARQRLEPDHGVLGWIPAHLIDLTAARAAWADGHRPDQGDADGP